MPPISHIRLVVLSYPIDIDPMDLGTNECPCFVEYIAMLMVKYCDMNNDDTKDGMLRFCETSC